MIRRTGRVAFLIFVFLMLMIAGCSQTHTRNEVKPLILKIILPGNGKPAGLAKVMAEAERRLADANLNYKLDVTFIPWDELRQQTEVLLASGRDIDLIFDAPWLHAREMSNAGYYQPLDELLQQFGRDILASRPGEMIAANKIKGKLYGVPLGAYSIPVFGYIVRRDIREKLGFPEIRTYDDLVKFFYLVKDKEPELVPFAPDVADPLYTGTYKLNFDAAGSIRDVGITAYNHFMYYKNDDGIVYNLFDREEKAVWDAIRENRTFYKDGIIDKEILTDREALFPKGKAAVTTTRTIGIDKSYQLNVLSQLPDAKLEYVTFMKPDERRISNYKQAAIVAIPSVSRHKEEAMKFLNWANTKENYDLLTYGIEDDNWIAEGKDAYLPTANPYSGFAGYLIQNPILDRQDASQSKDVLSLGQWLRNPDHFESDPLAGFSFDPSLVFTDFSVFTSLVEKYNLPITLGVVDTNTYWKEFRSQAAIPARNVQKEMQQQINIYLENRK